MGVDELISLSLRSRDDKVQRLAVITTKNKAIKAGTFFAIELRADLSLDQKVIPPFLGLLKL
jgi:hypothetical protein